MNYKKYIVIITLCTTLFSVAQDVHFSQFMETPQLLNPGATGTFEGKMRVIANYRNQWGVLGTPYKTSAISFDMPIAKSADKAYLGFGVSFYKDVAGAANFGSILGSVSLAGILPINKTSSFSLGIQGGVTQYTADLSNLTWGNQFEQTEFNTDIRSGEQATLATRLTSDIGAGLYYTYHSAVSSIADKEKTRLSLGFSAFHLNQPKQELLHITSQRLPVKYVFQITLDESLDNSKFSIIPYAYTMFQGQHYQYNFGALIKKDFHSHQKYTGFEKGSSFYFGAHYRYKDAIIPQLFYEFHDYMLGFSYDINTSTLSSVSRGGGSFEISLKYINRHKALMQSHLKGSN
jgi:type IX secretion system PorP/SprF family membrane protein